MIEDRTARNEAWIASLVLHVALLAGVVAVIGRPRESPVGPVVVDTRLSGHEIGVVLLDRPMPEAIPLPIVVPVRQESRPVPAVPHTIVPPPPPSPIIRQTAHQETRPIENNPRTMDAHPSDEAPSYSPVAVAPGSPDPPMPLPAGAATTFFGVPAIGKSVVFVLDRSASMGLDGRLDRARRELAQSLRRLPPSARFQVIAYNRAAEPVRVRGQDGLLPATPEYIEEAIQAIDRLPAEGGSEHLNALTKALALVPDVVYFLTDEDDLEPRDVQIVTRRNHGRVSIHALCLAPPGKESPMQILARDNHGQFGVVGR